MRKHEFQQMTSYNKVRSEITEVKCAIFNGRQANYYHHIHCSHPRLDNLHQNSQTLTVLQHNGFQAHITRSSVPSFFHSQDERYSLIPRASELLKRFPVAIPVLHEVALQHLPLVVPGTHTLLKWGCSHSAVSFVLPYTML
ncbi:hypothetical protein MTO96_011039 [Rhipicephalus appendiculatus]